jgi:hypothetical protein
MCPRFARELLTVELFKAALEGLKDLAELRTFATALDAGTTKRKAAPAKRYLRFSILHLF